MADGQRPAFRIPPAGPVTKALVITILVSSLLFRLTEGWFGFGISDLAYHVPKVLEAQLWRIVSYPIVVASPWALIIGLAVLWLFGGWFEGRWGGHDFFWFFATSCVGAGIIAVPLFFLFNLVLPFQDVGVAAGPKPAIDAMLVSLAITAPNSNVLFGFLIPIRAKTMVWAFLGFELVFGIMTGASALSVTLGGMAMGYLLTTGNWRPSRWLDLLRLQSLRRKRRGLYVVKPNDKDHTLH